MVQKELRKLSQWFWKGFLKWYDGGGENGITSKRFFEVEVFFSSQNITSHLFEETLGAFISLPFFSLLHLLRTWTWGFWWYLRRKSLLQILFSNGFNILAVDANSRMELCMPTWLNHDYGDGRLVEILAVDAYSGVELCMPIFFGWG
jgi:hypothetical protein